MPKNYPKLAINWLKNQLKSVLIRYYNYPEGKYISEFLRGLEKDFVKFVMKLFGYGLVSFLFLFGLLMVFPILHRFILLGTSPLTTFLVIFLLGLIVLVIQQVYEWKRSVM